VKPTIEIDFL